MVRFFVAPHDVSGGMIRLSAEDAEHIRSLRLRPSELFIVCDGEGTDYICRLGERGDGSAAGIVEQRQSRGEPSVACSVFIAYAKGDRLEYAVQKSVELGAFDIVLYPSERCISVPRDIDKKALRLQKIALETAKQCGRGRVPVVSVAGSFRDAVGWASGKLKVESGKLKVESGGAKTESGKKKVDNGDSKAESGDPILCGETIGSLSIFCYEEEKKKSLKQALEMHDFTYSTAVGGGGDNEDGKQGEGGGSAEPGVANRISIMTGSEGGFAPDEAKLATAAGMTPVSLGPRILRCETAPVAALAAVMFHTGNM